MSRARSFLFAVVACLPMMTIACGSSSAKSDAGKDAGIDAGPPSVTCTNGTIVANEANDYSFSSSLMLHPVTVKAMSDLTFNWGGVTTDFLGQPVNAKTDLNTIFLLLVNLPAATFEMQLNNDTFATSVIAIPGPPPSFMPTGGVTTTTLYNNFVSADGPVDATLAAQYLDAATYTPANSTFVIGAQTGTNIGSSIRMLQSFQLDPSSSNTTVTLTNSSTTLSYMANLHSLHPTGVPAGTAALTLDWGQVATNALGQPFVATNVGNAIVGHYSQTPAQLESQFLDLQTIAEDLYTATIPSGTVLDFTQLMDKSGNSFPGVDSTGTWLVALICTNCRNPAPYYLTILEPAAQPCATQ
jgi:hypothetical protein